MYESNIAKKELNGLVLMNSPNGLQAGMDRVISLVAPSLAERGTFLHLANCSRSYNFLRSMAKFALKTRRVKFDFLLINALSALTSPVTHITAATFIKANKPVFIYWHELGMIFDEIRKLDAGILRRVDKIASLPRVKHMCVSNASKQVIKSRYPNTNPEVIYNCTAIPDQFDNVIHPSDDPPLVINIASIQYKKGTDLFVDIAIKVCEKHPKVEFLWLGGGSAYDNWQENINAAGLNNRILFPGYSNTSFLFLRRASAFLLTSREDAFPLANLEAMALARRIVTFDTGGAPEALGEYGVKITPFDTDAAAQEILRILSMSPRDRVDPNTRQLYQSLYTPNIFADRINKYLRDNLY